MCSQVELHLLMSLGKKIEFKIIEPIFKTESSHLSHHMSWEIILHDFQNTKYRFDRSSVSKGSSEQHSKVEIFQT